MIEIEFSPGAVKDLRSIRRETKRGWGDTGLEKLNLKLNARLLSLSLNPDIGPSRDDILPGLRSLSLPPFVIFYRPRKNRIDIVRVFAARRDYPRIMRRIIGKEPRGD